MSEAMKNSPTPGDTRSVMHQRASRADEEQAFYADLALLLSRQARFSLVSADAKLRRMRSLLMGRDAMPLIELLREKGVIDAKEARILGQAAVADHDKTAEPCDPTHNLLALGPTPHCA